MCIMSQLSDHVHGNSSFCQRSRAPGSLVWFINPPQWHCCYSQLHDHHSPCASGFSAKIFLWASPPMSARACARDFWVAIWVACVPGRSRDQFSSVRWSNPDPAWACNSGIILLSVSDSHWSCNSPMVCTLWKDKPHHDRPVEKFTNHHKSCWNSLTSISNIEPPAFHPRNVSHFDGLRACMWNSHSQQVLQHLASRPTAATPEGWTNDAIQDIIISNPPSPVGSRPQHSQHCPRLLLPHRDCPSGRGLVAAVVKDCNYIYVSIYIYRTRIQNGMTATKSQHL